MARTHRASIVAAAGPSAPRAFAALSGGALEAVSGGGLSTTERAIGTTYRYDDGSSLTTAVVDGDLRTHAVPAFDGRLAQGRIGDCFVVAPLNALLATPSGRAYADSLVREVGPNQYEVKLRDFDDRSERTVQVSLPGEGASGEPRYQALEKAIGTVNATALETDAYGPIANGGNSGRIMVNLGLTNVSRQSDFGFRGDAPPDGVVAVAATPADRDVGYGLIQNHQYAVVGKGTDGITGEPMLYLANPHGNEGTLAVPMRVADESLRLNFAGEVPRVDETVTPSPPPITIKPESEVPAQMPFVSPEGGPGEPFDAPDTVAPTTEPGPANDAAYDNPDNLSFDDGSSALASGVSAASVDEGETQLDAPVGESGEETA